MLIELLEEFDFNLKKKWFKSSKYSINGGLQYLNQSIENSLNWFSNYKKFLGKLSKSLPLIIRDFNDFN